MAEAIRNDPDCFVMSQAWNETTVHDLEDAPLAFDCSIRSLIENTAHLAVALRRVPAAVHTRALFLSWACSYPRGELFGGGEGSCFGTHFGDNLLRRIHSEPGDYRQPLDCILVPLEQTRDLLVQLTDLLLDELQVVKRHLNQPTIDRVDLRTGTQRVMQLRRRGAQALIGQGGQSRRIDLSVR